MKRTSIAILWILLLAGAAASLAFRNAGSEADVVDIAPAGGEHDDTLERAETLYREGSYAMAHELYLELDGSELPEEEARWVDFRLADTLWRSRAASETSDSSEFDRARSRLEELLDAVKREEERDSVWAEAHESLGDFWWVRRDTRDWGQAWGHYEQALGWWGASRDIGLARDRYLGIVWKAARPSWVEPYEYYGYYGNQIPIEILQNALEIAEDPGHRARASYLIAMTLRSVGGDRRHHRRVTEAFEAALAAGRSSDWHDDALFHYAEWLARGGRLVRQEGGGWSQQPDYARALDLFRQLQREYRKGESRYFDQAAEQTRNITDPVVGVSVSTFFLPGSEIQYHLSWRNVESIRLSLHRVDLTRDIEFTGSSGAWSWLERIDLAGHPRQAWSHVTNDAGDHIPGQAALRLEEKLPAGAYVLEARAGDRSARELVLVTDTSLVLKTSQRQALVFLCDAMDGSPRAEARVSLWTRIPAGSGWSWRTASGHTDQDGLIVFDLHDRGAELFVASSHGDSQAFAISQRWAQGREVDPWKIHAFTDRPAYRPREVVQWKIVARRYDGTRYSTPSGETLRYRIDDPRGAAVEEGSIDLNRFGSAWGSLVPDETAPLGEYRVSFREESEDRTIGSATLFRLEEFKLPEFRVEVSTPGGDGERPIFRVGEEVEAEVSAEFYFGGPVADAKVEVLVYQRPLLVTWHPPREYGWYYHDMTPDARLWWGGGPGQNVHHEILRTDARGKARVRFETPAGSGQDFEYTVEARVTDASRREITGRGKVRVSRQSYYVFPRAEHNLYEPGDQVRIGIKTIDANEQPVAAAGTVVVTRDRWVEIWIDPEGREVSGADLDRRRRIGDPFPPPARPGHAGWRLKFGGYEHEEVLRSPAPTGQDGEGEVVFTPRTPGYYRTVWTGEEEDGPPIAGEATIWVADDRTTHTGYRHGGVEIIVDKDTFRAGSTTPVMLTAPVRGAHVLFSLEADDLYSYRLVHLEGTVKLLELEIGEQHVPNVFLEAAMVLDGNLFIDSRQVIVPPVDNFLQVEVKADKEEFRPREEGTLEIRTLDHRGRPVPAEVALGLVDSSVFYIQQEYAGDPREFFYGFKRGKHVSTASSFHHKRYASLEVNRDGTLVDRRATAGGEYLEGHAVDDGSRRYDREAGAASGSRIALAEIGRSAQKASFAPAAAPVASEEAALALDAIRGAPSDSPAVQVRSDFRATAFWKPDVITGDDGRARVTVTFPDSLTQWRATARAATASNGFGLAGTQARTSKPLIVRLQAPRFFVVGDSVTLSAVINNNTDTPMEVDASLKAEGLQILRRRGAQDPILVGAGGEERIDWSVAALESGTARLSVEARAEEHAAAMEREYPVHEHGIEKLVSRSGKVRGDEIRLRLEIPASRPGSAAMTVQVTPSLAVTMLDALPYLIDYPYGCTEQTMSRFLPSVITAGTLAKLGLRPDFVAGKIFGGMEPRHAEAIQRGERRDLDRLDDMVKEGLARLYDFQHADGGWGWWKEGESDHFMTAYVVWGLGLARDAGVDIRRQVLSDAQRFLEQELVEQEENPDIQAWMLHALATSIGPSSGPGSGFRSAAYENLWSRRDQLNAYSRSLLALAAHQFGDAQRARALARSLANGVKRDSSPDESVTGRPGSSSPGGIGTAHWGSDGLYRRWSEGGVEATSFALMALLSIDPENELIEPVTNWLIKNRRGAQWSNTRDTAITVLALTGYLTKSGELSTDLEFEVEVNGARVAGGRVTPEEILAAPSRFTVDPDLLREGANEIRLSRTGGNGPLYYSVEAVFFSMEEPIAAVGNEIFISRKLHKLAGRPTLLAGRVFDRVPLEDGDSVTSGERIEVTLTIEAKNHYEYLVFEDLKAAGFESVGVQSAEALYARELKSSASRVAPASREASDYTGRYRWVYQELRDRKVALFLDKLPEGLWEIRYDLRAETPGAFHALPVLGHAMYVPEIRCSGDEVRIEVQDSP